jgi:hypothetical protein
MSDEETAPHGASKPVEPRPDQPKTAPAPPNPAGAIGDAPAAFGTALLAAAKALGNEPAGDPRAMAAIQLGWVMGSLITPGAQTPMPSGFPISVETVYKAKALEFDSLLSRVKVDVAPGPDALKAMLSRGQPAATEAADWEPSLVAALLGAEVRLAKAYGVGRQLNVLAYDPQASLTSDAVTGMVDALDDLTSALPPHAGRAVANSVRSLQRATQPPTRLLLDAQCELWRIVLTGEKRATELLEPENYIDAAEKLAVELRATGTVLLRQYAVWVLLIVALVLAGGAILLFVPGGASKTAAGVSGILLALGLTWKGVGTSLGKLAGQLEAPLWGAELDGAVTAAITLGAPAPAKPTLRQRRRIKGGDYAGRTKRRPGIDPAAKAGE